jgi:protoporphyrinogen oxidase
MEKTTCDLGDVPVTVFEVADTAGGKIRSNSEGGFLWDEGANTMVSALLCFRFSDLDLES